MVDNKIDAPKEVLAIEYKKAPEMEEARPPSPPPPPPEAEPVKVEAPVAEPPDLLVIYGASNLCICFVVGLFYFENFEYSYIL